MKASTHNIKIGSGGHECDAVVLTCIDFRIRGRDVEAVVAAVYKDEEPVTSFDEIRIAGSAKAINDGKHAELILQSIKVGVEMHSAKRVVIINHHDCGAYGGFARFGGDENAERDFHATELKKAGKSVADFLASIGKNQVPVDLLFISETGVTPVAA